MNETALGPGASVGDYEIIVKCGAGTYGAVYRAIHKTTRRVVALKKVAKFPLEEGFPVECKYLEKLCSSRNIVNLLEYFYTQEGQLVLIFEYMEMDLWKLISGPNANVPLLQMKCIMKQLFEGLLQCHTAGIMHRDVKPSNLLINASGVLKLADFGLTTSFIKPPFLSNNVVSLYYRPPELLMGSNKYGPEIDIWSAGCILVELLTNDYLFAGSNESDQLDRIFKVFGTPDESVWPGISMLPGYGLVESGRQHPMRDLVDKYSYVDSNALDLAARLLQLDPKKRITSFEALRHPWFAVTPLPCIPSLLPNLWKDKKEKFCPPDASKATANYNKNHNHSQNKNQNQNQNQHQHQHQLQSQHQNQLQLQNQFQNQPQNQIQIQNHNFDHNHNPNHNHAPHNTNDFHNNPNTLYANNYNTNGFNNATTQDMMANNNFNYNMVNFNNMNDFQNNFGNVNNFYNNNSYANNYVPTPAEMYYYYLNYYLSVQANFNEQYFNHYNFNSNVDMFYNNNINNFNNYNNFNNNADYNYQGNYNTTKSFEVRGNGNFSHTHKGKFQMPYDPIRVP